MKSGNTNIERDIIGVGAVTGGTINQNITIYNDQGKKLTIKDDILKRETKIEEIESYIIANDLIIATKMIVEFVADFSTNKNLRREALLHQSSVKALNDDIRKFGKTSDTEREIKLLKYSLFEFLEILEEKNG